uniref:Carbohydrate kinase PfkB domain-containing protein n=1 Tax=Parascaris equorum TaxID=6256 RepID=A0A914S5F1_PAREQ
LETVLSIFSSFFSYTEVFPRPGESVRGLSFESGPGGKGANQAAQAARLGGNVLIIARVGNDSFGSQNINALKGQGVNIDYVEKSDTVGTATAMVTVSQHARAEELESVIAKAKIFLCQYEIKVDALRKALEVAKRNNGLTTHLLFIFHLGLK